MSQTAHCSLPAQFQDVFLALMGCFWAYDLIPGGLSVPVFFISVSNKQCWNFHINLLDLTRPSSPLNSKDKNFVAVTDAVYNAH